MSWRCDFCNTKVVPNGECPSCALYNVAVHAQLAAAREIAKAFSPRCRRAWLNKHGVFAYLNGKTVRVGLPEEAAPFVAMMGAARLVKRFWSNGDRTDPEPP